MGDYVAYPKAVYTKRDGKIINTVVQTPAELKALGPGWAESPDGPFTTPKRVVPKTKTSRF
mgnify:CR=1 FL=1